MLEHRALREKFTNSHDFLDQSLRFPFAAPAGMDDRDYALNFPAR